MLLDEESVNERLNSDRNLANRFGRERANGLSRQTPEPERVISGGEPAMPAPVSNIKEVILHRPGNNRKHLDPKMRETIAILARSGECQTSIAADFGVSDYEVHALKTGKIERGMDKPLIDAKLEKIRDIAVEKMMVSMGLITEEKMDKVSAKDLSTITANMSRVVEKTMPKQDGNGAGIQIVIFSPEQRSEGSYDTVEI